MNNMIDATGFKEEFLEEFRKLDKKEMFKWFDEEERKDLQKARYKIVRCDTPTSLINNFGIIEFYTDQETPQFIRIVESVNETVLEGQAGVSFSQGMYDRKRREYVGRGYNTFFHDGSKMSNFMAKLVSNVERVIRSTDSIWDSVENIKIEELDFVKFK